MSSHHQNINHMANHISWQADGQRKIAVSYGDLDFNPSRTQTIDSLIWDIGNLLRCRQSIAGNSLVLVNRKSQQTRDDSQARLVVEHDPIQSERHATATRRLSQWSSVYVLLVKVLSHSSAVSQGLFDLRRGSRPVEQSSIESSHREPVRNALWVQSKTGTEFFSGTTDGHIHWWDTKKMSEPVDTLLLDLEKKGRVPYASAITRLEYDPSIV